MNYTMICVGGTGQMALHYYLQLYLLGLIKDPFRAIVLDTDDTIESVDGVREFFQLLQHGDTIEQALGTSIPVIKSIRIAAKGGDKVLQILTGKRHLSEVGEHPARALFDDDSLEQDVVHGLFARPALSSVLSYEISHHPDLSIEANSNIVIVGSVIGGTGGGLIPSLIDAIEKRITSQQIQGTKLRAVIVGRYFRPDPSKIHESELRFPSNRTSVLKVLGESARELHSFHIIDTETPRIDRRPEEEKRGRNLSWPDSHNHPYWQAAIAAEHLLKDTVIDKKDEFEDREIPVPLQLQALTLQNARHRLQQALEIIDSVEAKGLVRRMCTDPWAFNLWGRGIPSIVTHFWNLAAKKMGAKAFVKDFPTLTQQQLTNLWVGKGNSPGLLSLFPTRADEKGQAVRPKQIRNLRWPSEIGEPYMRLFDSKETVAKKAAATLIYWALRLQIEKGV